MTRQKRYSAKTRPHTEDHHASSLHDQIAIPTFYSMSTTARSHAGFFYLAFYCFVALSSCFLVDGWRTSPLLAIWAVGAGVRWYLGDRQVASDSIIFGVLNVCLARDGLKAVTSRVWEEWYGSTVVGSTIVRFAIPLVLILIPARLRWETYRKSTEAKALPDGVAAWTLEYPKPRIFPCQTKHARMFPKRHAFEYSYLQCGFPIIPSGVTADGAEVGLGQDRRLGSWWLRIRAEDYLNRGDAALGFYGKLKKYLRSQVGSFEPFELSSMALLTVAACQ